MTIDDNQLSSNIHLKWHLALWLWQKVEKVVWWSDGDTSNWRACWCVCGCGPVSGCQYGLALNECWWWHRLQPPHSNNIICISEQCSEQSQFNIWWYIYYWNSQWTQLYQKGQLPIFCISITVYYTEDCWEWCDRLYVYPVLPGREPGTNQLVMRCVWWMDKVIVFSALAHLGPPAKLLL